MNEESIFLQTKPEEEHMLQVIKSNVQLHSLGLMHMCHEIFLLVIIPNILITFTPPKIICER